MYSRARRPCMGRDSPDDLMFSVLGAQYQLQRLSRELLDILCFLANFSLRYTLVPTGLSILTVVSMSRIGRNE